MKAKKKYLIINADDFGMCKSINNATIEACRKGVVTSISIMPCAPYFREAVKLAGKNGLSCAGIHLTLNSEFSRLRWGGVTPSSQIPSLIDKNGFLHKTIDALAKYAKTGEVILELENQIKSVINSGLRPTHLDCHMFSLHSKVSNRKDFPLIMLYLAKKYKLPLRCPFKNDAGLAKKSNVPILENSFKESYDIPYKDKVDRYNLFVSSCKKGVSEMILHCGYNNTELKNITKLSTRRQADFDYATSQDTKDLLKEYNMTLSRWEKTSRYL